MTEPDQEGLEAVASAIAIADGYDPNGTPPAEWPMWKDHYRKLAAAALAASPQPVSGGPEGEVGALREIQRALKAGDELGFAVLADVGPALTGIIDATDSDKLRGVASKLAGLRMDWDGAARELLAALSRVPADGEQPAGEFLRARGMSEPGVETVLALIDEEAEAEDVDVVAQVLHERSNSQLVPWKNLAESHRRQFRKDARLAIVALDALRASRPPVSGGPDVEVLIALALVTTSNSDVAEEVSAQTWDRLVLLGLAKTTSNITGEYETWITETGEQVLVAALSHVPEQPAARLTPELARMLISAVGKSRDPDATVLTDDEDAALCLLSRLAADGPVSASRPPETEESLADTEAIMHVEGKPLPGAELGGQQLTDDQELEQREIERLYREPKLTAAQAQALLDATKFLNECPSRIEAEALTTLRRLASGENPADG